MLFLSKMCQVILTISYLVSCRVSGFRKNIEFLQFADRILDSIVADVKLLGSTLRVDYRERFYIVKKNSEIILFSVCLRQECNIFIMESR